MDRHATRFRAFACAGTAATTFLLAGCNANAPAPVVTAAPPPAGYATQSYTPQNFTLPQGSGCHAVVARWQAIQNNDYASGNIGLPVYKQIKGEIAAASAACDAGKDAQARALIAESRKRHGYPE